jgi:hypothetical protein
MLNRVLSGSLIALLPALLAACLGGSAAYRPSDDPLVLAYFERSLNESQIAYRRDYEGMYLAADRSQQEELEKLGEAALELDPGRKGLQVMAGCAANRLRDYLDGEAALYVVSRQSESAFVQMLETDFTRLEVGERYEQFQADCSD